VLAFKVLTGRVPIETERRYWNQSAQSPVLLEVHDWTTDRRIFSCLVWPPLESPAESAEADHFERVQQVKQVIAKGAAEQVLTTRFETDYGLRWDYEAKCWRASDSYRYDGLDETDIRSGQGPSPDRGQNGAPSSSSGAPAPKTRER
jgi:hypothetical protein